MTDMILELVPLATTVAAALYYLAAAISAVAVSILVLAIRRK